MLSTPPSANKGLYILMLKYVLSCSMLSGFVSLKMTSQGAVVTAKLPSESQYVSGWVTQTIVLGEDIGALDYHDTENSYLIGTSRKCDFKMPETELFFYEHGNEGGDETEHS